MQTFRVLPAILIAASLALAGCGGGGDPGGKNPPGGNNPPVDREPDSFSFQAVENAEPGKFYEQKVTIAGLEEGESVPAQVADIRGGYEFFINDEKQENNLDRRVKNGDEVLIRVKASDVAEGVVSVEFFAGEPFVSAVFSVTTRADVTAPDIAVHYPPSSGYTDAEGIRLRGVASDDLGAVALTVNDTVVPVDPETGAWQHELALVAGANPIHIVLQDAAGNTAIRDLLIDTTSETAGSGEPMPDASQAAEVSADGTKLFFGGFTENTIYQLDLSTGTRSVLSREPDIGSGPSLVSMRGMSRGRTDHELLIAIHQRMLAIDLPSGNRTVLSDDAGIGAGPVFNAQQVVYDPVSGLLYVASGDAEDWISSVALPSGDREIVSGLTVGVGPDLEGPVTIAVDESTGDIFAAVDAVVGSVVRINPANGDRTEVSAGAGVELGRIGELRYWQEEELVLVVDAGNDALVAVDPESGDKVPVSHGDTGRGPNLGFRQAMGLHGPSRVAYVVDSAEGIRIYAVDLESGDRLVIAAD